MTRPHAQPNAANPDRPATAVALRDDPPDTFADFQSRLHTGDYQALPDRGLRRALQATAADPGLDLELGAIRIALLRLLREECDLDRLGANAARLVRVAAQIAALRPGPDSALDQIQAGLQRAIEEIEREDWRYFDKQTYRYLPEDAIILRAEDP